MSTDEFLIQHLGPRHRDAFKALIGPSEADDQATATFNDTLAGQEDDLSVCLVAETRDGTLLGIARAHGPVDMDEDTVLIDSRIAVLDLLVANSETVGDALLVRLAGAVHQIGCGQLLETYSAETA